jgi:hypothetical protein
MQWKITKLIDIHVRQQWHLVRGACHSELVLMTGASRRRVLAQSLYYTFKCSFGGGSLYNERSEMKGAPARRALFRHGADDNNNRASDCCRVVGTLAIHPSLSLNTAQRVTTLITRGCCMLLGVLYLQQGRGVNPNIWKVSLLLSMHIVSPTDEPINIWHAEIDI